jgi:uncharacterized membrane protein (UPF0127 family)
VTAPGSAPTTTVPFASHIAGATPATAPFDAFEQVRVKIVSSDGKTRTPCMLLARTEARRELGLMHVASGELSGYAGMVFAFDSDVDGSFTMQDTLIPLSIVFVDATGHPVARSEMTPCPTGGTTCPTYPASTRYRMAIEVPAGQLGSLGLDRDATVEVGGACHTPSP